jgi:type VI secretion system protein VasD
MQSFKKLLKVSILISLIAVLAACAYTREKLGLTTTVEFELTVSSTVNPDSDGRASPVVLNLLYLKDNRQFEQEDFIALLESPEDRLGKDLIEKIRLKEFIPSEVRDLINVLPEGVNYVGIIAEFIQYQDAKGKLILPIESHSSNEFSVSVDKDSISIID